MKFHLSKKYLGPNVTLYPKVPESSVISIEGDIPRVCFSKNPYYCVRSMCGGSTLMTSDMQEFKDKHISVFDEDYENKKDNFIIINPSIYITNENLYTPPAASDFKANFEKWSISPISVTFIGYLCLKSFIDRKLVIVNSNNTLEKEILQNSLELPIYRPISMKLTR